jgi:uncharacterized protein (TIGR02118 family)
VHKLMVIFHTPSDPTTFERSWSESFVRAAEQMPGVRRVAVSRAAGGPAGPVDVYLVHEFFFEDLRAVQEAMASPEGQTAWRALMSLAGEEVTLCFADHLEMTIDRPQALADA